MKLWVAIRTWWQKRSQVLDTSLLSDIVFDIAPLDLRIVGRMVFHAALVGLAAGLIGAGFFVALEYLQRLLLEELAGYTILRAHGETLGVQDFTVRPFRPLLLAVLPGLGGLLCGVVTHFVPEARGGGADGMIDAFHHRNGVIRARVILGKALASLCTLGTGGAGGREGPTMLIGGALGSLVARVLNVTARERRILLVAGVAAGIAAVFRTPLGAALLAVEVLYQDGYESEALIPSVLASVVSYSVVITLFGESTLFAHAPRFPFIPAHLPVYALLAICIAALAALFVFVLRKSQRLFASLPVPAWLRPGIGGLLLGAMVTPMIVLLGEKVGKNGQGLGLLGGGYGAIQTAISGADWFPEGFGAVYLLLSLSVLKLLAASLTVGSQGSAGDFAPSLAIGGLFGGAFGRAFQLLSEDPRVDPGAFALVGMGVFYGGIAHVPLAALVLVCELAGNYDLLVPLMLAQAIAFVALNKTKLYEAQLPTLQDSPVHRDNARRDVLFGIGVSEVMLSSKKVASFERQTTVKDMTLRLGESPWQDVFPVFENGKLEGLVSASRLMSLPPDSSGISATAASIMQAPVWVLPTDPLQHAIEQLVQHQLREIPVLDASGTLVGLLGEREIAQAYLSRQPRGDS